MITKSVMTCIFSKMGRQGRSQHRATEAIASVFRSDRSERLRTAEVLSENIFLAFLAFSPKLAELLC